MTSDLSDPLWPIDTPVRWNARWIAPRGAAGGGSVYLRARRVFNLSAVPSSAIVHIAAESIYRLYLNGRLIGRGPVRGTGTVNFFDSYNVTRFLRPGKNIIAVGVHSPTRASFKYFPAEPAVLLQSDDLALATDASWQVQIAPEYRRDAPLFAYQIGRMEWKDFRHEPIGWQTGQDTGVWESPILIGDSVQIGGKVLKPRDIPALASTHHSPVDVPVFAGVPPVTDLHDPAVAHLMTVEPHRPITAPDNLSQLLSADGDPVVIHPSPDGAGVMLVFDFARAVNGGFELDLEGPAGTVVDIGYEEQLVDGRLRPCVTEYTLADRYILRAGRQTVGSEYAERGYRMVQLVLRNFAAPVRLLGIRGEDILYPYVERGSFSGSHALLNALWPLSTRTLAACTTDTFVDCPWRENTCYLNDMIVEAVTSLQAFGDGRIVERSMRLAASQVRPDGLFPSAVPYGQAQDMDLPGSLDRMTLTGGNLTFPLVLEDYFLYTGDHRASAELIEQMLPMFERFQSWENADGIAVPPVKLWNFIDWSFPIHMANRATASLEWLRVLSLDATARILRRIDPARDVSALVDKADALTDAILRTFWSSQDQHFIEGIEDEAGNPMVTQLAQSLALLSGRLTPDLHEAAIEALLRNDLRPPELFMHHFVLRALVEAGHADIALERIERYWGPIVASGSPTIWELNVHQFGKSGFNGAGSLCHGFSTTPIDFMQGAILGVRPLTPGFALCRFNPYSAGLDHATGRVPTPHGNIHVKWRRVSAGLEVSLTIPHGVEMLLTDGQRLRRGHHSIVLPDRHRAQSRARTRPAGELVVI